MIINTEYVDGQLSPSQIENLRHLEGLDSRRHGAGSMAFRAAMAYCREVEAAANGIANVIDN